MTAKITNISACNNPIIPVTEYVDQKHKRQIEFAHILLEKNGFSPFYDTNDKGEVRVVRKREPRELWPAKNTTESITGRQAKGQS